MKKLLFPAMILSLAFIACKPEDKNIYVAGITLSRTTATLNVGGILTLTTTIQPHNATNQNKTWTSSDTTVATVTNDGRVTALSLGTTTISVTTEDRKKTATCEITVNSIDVENIRLNITSASLFPSDTLTLLAMISPTNATDRIATWTSSNPSIATVENGVVIAVAPGEVTITASAQNGEKTATCNVIVDPIGTPKLPSKIVSTSSLGRLTSTYLYDDQNRLVEMIQTNVSNSSNSLNLSYDANGKLTSVSSEYFSFSVNYPEDNLTEMIFDKDTMRFMHDANGKIIGIDEFGSYVEFAYINGNITEILLDDDTSVTITYSDILNIFRNAIIQDCLYFIFDLGGVVFPSKNMYSKFGESEVTYRTNAGGYVSSSRTTERFGNNTLFTNRTFEYINAK